MRDACDAPQLDGRVVDGVDVQRGDTWTRRWEAQTHERGRVDSCAGCTFSARCVCINSSFALTNWKLSLVYIVFFDKTVPNNVKLFRILMSLFLFEM